MLKYILLVLLLSLLSGCTVNEQSLEPIETEDGKLVLDSTTDIEGDSNDVEKVEYKKITPEEAKEMMIEGNIILDVRTQAEYDQGYIEGATLLPLDSILDDNLESLPDKNQIILVYCRSGNRSATAAKALIDAGYTNVYDFGGIIDWPY
ncbi:MAG: rhodanese-like domain-containing protein [Vallitalea sp.]|jgi:rhodanese-related sulfurtransferase|nr:rhodanese-like domain-containing protein [Vallitalea sp.]